MVRDSHPLLHAVCAARGVRLCAVAAHCDGSFESWLAVGVMCDYSGPLAAAC